MLVGRAAAGLVIGSVLLAVNNEPVSDHERAIALIEQATSEGEGRVQVLACTRRSRKQRAALEACRDASPASSPSNSPFRQRRGPGGVRI